MLRKSFAFIGTLIALIFMAGLQTRSSAQSAASSSWATSNSVTISIYGTALFDGTGKLSGSIGVSGSGFIAKGTVSSLSVNIDWFSGTYTATLTGSGNYYSVVKNVVQPISKKAVTATLVLSILADGTSTEGISLVDSSGNVVYSTGTGTDGSLSLWGVSKGSISISL